MRRRIATALVLLTTTHHSFRYSDKLKDALGGDVVTLKAVDNLAAVAELKEKFALSPSFQDETISFSIAQGEKFLARLMEGFRAV